MKTVGWLIVDDESEGVKFGKGWRKVHNNNGDQVGNWTHRPGRNAPEAVYPLPVVKSGRYTLMGKVPYAYSAKPGSKTVFKIVSAGNEKLFSADQAQSTGQWIKLGEFDLEPGATLAIIPQKSNGFVAADGFALIGKDD